MCGDIFIVTKVLGLLPQREWIAYRTFFTIAVLVVSPFIALYGEHSNISALTQFILSSQNLTAFMAVYVMSDYFVRVVYYLLNHCCHRYHSVMVFPPELGPFGFLVPAVNLRNNHFFAMDSRVLSVNIHLNACVFSNSLLSCVFNVISTSSCRS